MVNIANDVLVFAMKYDKFKEDVINFLDRCVEHNLHLNPEKIRINVGSVPFFAQTLMKDGLQMDANKWQVIQNWPQPKNVKELQSFLGSVNYLSKFIPYLSSFRKPLQDLLKSGNEFVWLKIHDKAFNTLKNAILKDVTLKYFDTGLPIYVMILHYNTTLTPSSKAIYSGTKYYDTHIEFHSLFLDVSSGTELLIIVVLLSCISKLHVITTIPKSQLN